MWRASLTFPLLPVLVLANTQFPLSSSFAELLSPSSSFSVSSNVTGANYIFNTLSSLLLQLPNTLHNHGHTIVPATIDAHTLLYHARLDEQVPPPSPEWLAFEPEMSYSIMAGRPWGNGTLLLTYAAKRDLQVLVLDGESARLDGEGPLDTQEILIDRKGGVLPPGRGWWDDYTRAEKLCKWAKGKGVEGFVRMNAGFELLWCDYAVGLELVSHLNITAPDSPPPMRWPFPRRPGTPANPPTGGRPPEGPPPDDPPFDGPPPDGTPTDVHPRDGPGRRPSRGPGRGPRWGERSPFLKSSGFEWLRIATHRFEMPQPHIRLISSGMLTFYDPQFTSLLPSREGKHMSKHRVWANISDEDAGRAMDQMEEVLARQDIWTNRGVDWSSIARRVVERWGDRLAQIRDTIKDGEEDRNATVIVEEVRLLAYTLLNPHLDTRTLPSSNTSDPAVWLPPTLTRCMSSRTAFIPVDSLTSQEHLLKSSIETVQSRLCVLAGQLLAESIGPADEKQDEKLLVRWERLVRETMEWLDWSMWVRCDEACGWDSICTLPIWPIGMGWPVMGNNTQPRCVHFHEWISEGGHMF